MRNDLPPLKPLTTGELLDRTFAYYRHHFVLFVGIMALPGLLSLLFQLPLLLVRSGAASIAFSITSGLVSVVITVIASTLSQGATVIAVSQLQLGRETNINEAFTTIRAQLGELVIIIMNVGIRVLLGFFLLIVPGILLGLKYAVTVPVAVLEQPGISASLARSGDLTRGDRGRIFVIYFLLFVLLIAAGLVWQVPAMMLARTLTGVTRPQQMPIAAQVVVQFGGFVSQSVLGPIMTIALTLVYYDERVRKEAFDLVHMMEQLDRTGLGASPSA
jgi:hypothetical protein